MNNELTNIIITTGGTGGHVFPAYSLAKHFIEKKVDVKLISDKRGMRYLKDYHDVNITEIESSTISKKNPLKFFISISIILYSIVRSFIFLLFNKSNLVFGMGGYSSLPMCIAAKILRVPFIIYENNLHIGKANKFLLPFAKKAFVSHIDLEGISDKHKNKLCEIGNIIRKEILNFKNKPKNDEKDEQMFVLPLGRSACTLESFSRPDVITQQILTHRNVRTPAPLPPQAGSCSIKVHPAPTTRAAETYKITLVKHATVRANHTHTHTHTFTCTLCCFIRRGYTSGTASTQLHLIILTTFITFITNAHIYFPSPSLLLR